MDHDTPTPYESPKRPAPEQDNAQELLPDWLRAQLPDLASAHQTDDPPVICKYFTPDSNWTWYVLEGAVTHDLQDNPDVLFFGYVEGFEHELGYFSLSELQTARGPMGLKIERDLYFQPQPLSNVYRALGLGFRLDALDAQIARAGSEDSEATEETEDMEDEQPEVSVETLIERDLHERRRRGVDTEGTSQQ